MRSSSAARFGRTAGRVVAAVLLLTAVFAQVAICAALVFHLHGVLVADAAAPPLLLALGAALFVAALFMLAACAALLCGYLVTRRSPAEERSAYGRWSRHWAARLLERKDDAFADDALGDDPRGRGPLDARALDALLELEAALEGEHREAARELLEVYGAEDRLVRATRSVSGRERRRALEALGRLRSPAALPRLLEALEVRDPEERLRAARAVARTLAVLDEPDPRAAQRVRPELRAFAEWLNAADLAVGSRRELLLLLGHRATEVLPLALGANASLPLARAALDCVAALRLEEVAGWVVPYLESPNAELRAAALRAVASFERLPDDLRDDVDGEVLAAARDEQPFVRTQAARAARHALEPHATLEALLADPSWWVRRAAARTLGSLGPAGRRSLVQSARRHRDPFARQMARLALLERPRGPRGRAALRERMPAPAAGTPV